ncbi:MAG: hypothetical protein RLZ28_1204 [Actinomycetota bacterium]|jgi:hypothetical protein
MIDHSIEPGHGDSVASWTTVIIIMVAVTAGTLFFYLNVPALVYASVGLVVVGLIVGWLLKRAGYGVNGSKSAGH